MSVRVRFAPSPTGHLHVGGARTAIFNWLFARHHGGRFVIRVEDTDQERSTRESEQVVLDDLRWLGLAWDEGPDLGGPHQPYRQSERREIYAASAETLLREGSAYRCFCTEDVLEQKRRDAEARSLPPHYDRSCLNLSPEEVESRLDSATPFVVRFHVGRGEDSGDVTIHDAIRGEVTWKGESLGDFILLRSDGMPTYNFSVAVDDHDMEITHVIRAEEHLTNTHRQVLVYRAMGWPVPRFAHVSLILGEDRSKLSKRHGASSVAAFAAKGYLPEAMVNYLTLLGWSMPGGDEKFSAEAAIREFDLSRINPAPAVFDETKLRWLNGSYLHELEPAELARRARPFIEDAALEFEKGDAPRFWEHAAAAVGKSLHTLDELVPMLEFVFTWDPQKVIEGEETGPPLREAGIDFLESLDEELRERGGPRDADEARRLIDAVKGRTGRKGKALFMPLRIAMTGLAHGPELPAALTLIRLGAESGIGEVTPLERRVDSLLDLMRSA